MLFGDLSVGTTKIAPYILQRGWHWEGYSGMESELKQKLEINGSPLALLVLISLTQAGIKENGNYDIIYIYIVLSFRVRRGSNGSDP